MTDTPNPYADAFRVAPSTSDALAGLNMPLQDAMLTQRAVRRVHAEPVDDAVVLKCIELALRAPTGANGQNWEFIVVKDRQVIKKLAGRYRKGWKFSYGGLLSSAGDDDPSLAKVIRAAQWQVDHFTEIPVLVVACLTTDRPRGPCAVFADAACRGLGILGVDLPERAESSIGGAQHGPGRLADHFAAVGSEPGPENSRPAALGDAVLRGGTRLAPRALRPDHTDSGRAGRAPRHLRQSRLVGHLAHILKAASIC